MRHAPKSMRQPEKNYIYSNIYIFQYIIVQYGNTHILISLDFDWFFTLVNKLVFIQVFW